MSGDVAVQTATPQPVKSHSPSLLLQRKCSCGGSAGLTSECTGCQSKRLLGKQLQTKLRVNKPGDEYEQEADRVAEQVMRMSEPNRQPDASKTAGRSLVQRKVSGSNAGIGAAPSIVQDVLSSPGQPLDPASRAFFEPRFGHDLSQVLIHTDTQAAGSARAVDARAYTVGQHIAFDAGQYAPTTSEGKRLLAHELTHTMQQHNHKSLGIGTVSSMRIHRHVEHDKHGAERTFSATTHISERQQPSTYHVTPMRLDHPLAVQRVCKGSAKGGNAIVSAKEDDYKQAVKAGAYCRDSGFTGALHSGTCYREVPPRSSYWNCPGGDQVCFDEGACKDSPDKRSPVEKQEDDGSCNLSGWCAMRHGGREVEPVQGAILGKLLWPVGGTAIGALIGWLAGRE
jgi:hypothetical protein